MTAFDFCFGDILRKVPVCARFNIVQNDFMPFVWA